MSLLRNLSPTRRLWRPLPRRPGVSGGPCPADPALVAGSGAEMPEPVPSDARHGPGPRAVAVVVRDGRLLVTKRRYDADYAA
jgi:hypothetical protein